MTADSSGPDLKTLWLDQEQETDPVTLEQIHALIRKYDRRTRRTILLFPLALLIIGLAAGRRWTSVHDPLDQTLVVASVLGVAAACFITWRTVYPTRDPAEPGGAYLRRRLQRRLTHLKGGWMIALLPLVPTIVLSEYLAFTHAQGSLWVRGLGILPLVAIAAVVPIRTWAGARKVKAELDELDGLMRR